MYPSTRRRSDDGVALARRTDEPDQLDLRRVVRSPIVARGSLGCHASADLPRRPLPRPRRRPRGQRRGHQAPSSRAGARAAPGSGGRRRGDEPGAHQAHGPRQRGVSTCCATKTDGASTTGRTRGPVLRPGVGRAAATPMGPERLGRRHRDRRDRSPPTSTRPRASAGATPRRATAATACRAIDPFSARERAEDPGAAPGEPAQWPHPHPSDPPPRPAPVTRRVARDLARVRQVPGPHARPGGGLRADVHRLDRAHDHPRPGPRGQGARHPGRPRRAGHRAPRSTADARLRSRSGP